jgi:hypothetical protein
VLKFATADMGTDNKTAMGVCFLFARIMKNHFGRRVSEPVGKLFSSAAVRARPSALNSERRLIKGFILGRDALDRAQ